jgi:ribosomal protein S18 acetylase RimI-like enzyme
MGLSPDRFVTAECPIGVDIRAAGTADVDAVAAIDAAAFGESLEWTRRWVEPCLGASGFSVALATLHGTAVGIATAILTNDRAGRCAGIFGVGVLEGARRRGIASAMTSWLLEGAFAEGARLAHLNPDSDHAAKLYAQLGFVECAGLDIYTDL